MDVPVRVIAKVRPLLPYQQENGTSCVQVDPSSSHVYLGCDHYCEFDAVYGPEASQLGVYASSVADLVGSFFQGYNVTIMSYGQQGSGKSYNLIGPDFMWAMNEEEFGVIPRAVRQIFQMMKMTQNREYRVHVTYLGLFREQVFDLLSTSGSYVVLNVLEDETGSVIVPGLNVVDCGTVDEVINCLETGLFQLHTWSVHNDARSQAHTILSIVLEHQWMESGGKQTYMSSRITFVDLCGESNNSAVSSPLGGTLMMPGNPFTQYSDLRVLRSVIESLADPEYFGTVPYRESKLTHILKDAFGGNCLGLMICSLSPSASDFEVTFSTLKYGGLTRYVINCPMVNVAIQHSAPASSVSRTPGSTNSSWQQQSGHQSEPVGVVASIVLPQPSPGVARRSSDPSLNQITQNENTFRLQFASSQWQVLVANAENLFTQMLRNESLSSSEKSHIQSWLCQKAEMDECLDNEPSARRPSLDVIAETTEPVSDNVEDVAEADSDVESSSELSSMGEEFYDELAVRKNRFSLMNRENVVQVENGDTLEHLKALRDLRDISNGGNHSKENDTMENCNDIHINKIPDKCCGSDSLSSSLNSDLSEDEECCQDNESKISAKFDDASAELKDSQPPRLNLSSKSAKLKLKQLTETIKLKESFIRELVECGGDAENAKRKCRSKMQRVTQELKRAAELYHDAQAETDDCVEDGQSDNRLDVLKQRMRHCQRKLDALGRVAAISDQTDLKLDELESSVYQMRRQQQDLLMCLKEDSKLQHKLESQLNARRDRRSVTGRKSSLVEDENVEQEFYSPEEEQLLATYSTTDILTVESPSVEDQKYNIAANENFDTVEANLRIEINHLRNARDALVVRRQRVNRHIMRGSGVRLRDERRLLELDEAVEAIDAAIEFKNEMICGRELDLTSRARLLSKDNLLTRLRNLNSDEMSSLLVKYFNKVVDIRIEFRKHELAFAELENEYDVKCHYISELKTAYQQASLEMERRITAQQREYQHKINTLLRHFNEDSSGSSAVESRFRELEDCANYYKEMCRHLKSKLLHPKDSKEVKEIKEINMKDQMTAHHSRAAATPQPLGGASRNRRRSFLSHSNAPLLLRNPAAEIENRYDEEPPRTKVMRERNKIIIQQKQ